VSLAGTMAKNTTLGFITSISEMGIAFVSATILTRALGTEQYGLYAYIIWLFTLAGIINNLGLGEMTRRFIPEAIGRNNTDEPAGFIQMGLAFRVVSALLTCLVIILSSGYWLRMSGEVGSQLVFVLCAISVFPEALQQGLAAIFKGFQRFDYALYISLVMYPLRLLLLVILVTQGFDITTVLSINIATLSMGVVAGFFFLSKLIPLKRLFSRSILTPERRNQAFKYSITVAGIMCLSYLVSTQTEIFFIGLYSSVENVGFFSLAFKIGMLAGLLPNAFVYVLLPSIAEQFGKGQIEKMKQIYFTSIRYMLLLVVPIAVGGIVLAESLIVFFYGTDYTPAIRIFQIINLPIAVSSIAAASDAVIRGINRPGFILMSTSIFSVVNIGLSFALIPRFGIIGATAAYSATMMLGLPVYVLFIRKTLGVNWPIKDTIKIMISSFLMGGSIYLIQKEFQLSPLLNLVIFIPVGIVLYIIAIFAFRIIRARDLLVLRDLQYSLPASARKVYSSLVSFAEILAGKKNLENETEKLDITDDETRVE
jgi:O-antigen/teichoic acid export membrane protein